MKALCIIDTLEKWMLLLPAVICTSLIKSPVTVCLSLELLIISQFHRDELHFWKSVSSPSELVPWEIVFLFHIKEIAFRILEFFNLVGVSVSDHTAYSTSKPFPPSVFYNLYRGWRNEDVRHRTIQNTSNPAILPCLPKLCLQFLPLKW
jgi:hypothetical protein